MLLELQYKVTAGNSKDKEKEKIVLRNIINQIDRGILLGAPLSRIPNLLTNIATKLNNCYTGTIYFLI